MQKNLGRQSFCSYIFFEVDTGAEPGLCFSEISLSSAVCTGNETKQLNGLLDESVLKSTSPRVCNMLQCAPVLEVSVLSQLRGYQRLFSLP